jgi:hypothetical protein
MGDTDVNDRQYQGITQTLRAILLAEEDPTDFKIYTKSKDTMKKCFMGEDQSRTFRYALGYFIQTVALLTGNENCVFFPILHSNMLGMEVVKWPYKWWIRRDDPSVWFRNFSSHLQKEDSIIGVLATFSILNQKINVIEEPS